MIDFDVALESVLTNGDEWQCWRALRLSGDSLPPMPHVSGQDDDGSFSGAGGTPSAILIDAHGNIASKLVVGASEVLGLLTPIYPIVCADCVADCKEHGGGEACVTVCMMAGKCR